MSAEVFSAEGLEVENNAPAKGEDSNTQEEVDKVDEGQGDCGCYCCIVILGSFMIHFITGGIKDSVKAFSKDFEEHFNCTETDVDRFVSLMLAVAEFSGNIVNIHFRIILRFLVKLQAHYQRVSIATYASAGIARGGMSVCLSVCPSVRHTPVLYQNEES